VTASSSRAVLVAEAQQDELAFAVERTASARAIAGNTIEHFPQSPAALDGIIDMIAGAQHWIHFENCKACNAACCVSVDFSQSSMVSLRNRCCSSNVICSCTESPLAVV